MTDARVVVLREFGLLEIEEIELPTLQDHQLEVELLAAGIQRRQMAQVQAATGDKWRPALLGLEGVGIVRAAGSSASRFKPGDVVVTGPPIEAGRVLQQSTFRFGGGASQTVPVVTWATTTVIDEAYLHAAPLLSADRERLAVVGDTVSQSVAAVRAARMAPGASVLVCGTGAGGLSAIAAAKASGADKIVAYGDNELGRKLAATVGATGIRCELDDELPTFQHVIDCVGEYRGGSPGVRLLEAAQSACRIPLNPSIYSGARPVPDAPDATVADLRDALRWIEGGALELEHLIRRRYTIEQINEAVLDLETDGAAGMPILTVEPLR